MSTHKIINATVDAILKEDLSEETAIQCSVYAGTVADVTMQALEEGLAAASVKTAEVAVGAAVDAAKAGQPLDGEALGIIVRKKVLALKQVRRLHSLVSHLVEFAGRMSASAEEFCQAEEQEQKVSNNRFN